MNDIKNSELLEKIIEHAKSYGGEGKSALTAEKYLVSAIDVVFGATAIDINEEEKSKIIKVLSDIFPEDSGFENVKKYFKEYVVEQKDSSYLDSLYMQQCIYRAKDTAKKTGMEQLSPDLLLKCIFEDPNMNIRSYMIAAIKTNEDDVLNSVAATDDVLKNIGKKSGEVFSEKPEESAEKTNINEPETKSSSKSTVEEFTEKAKSIYEILKESVYGQDNAISVFTSGYFRSETLSITDKDRTRPKATFLFAGPSGVGKTFLAETAADALGLPFRCFDMSEYSDKESNLMLCGFAKTYKDSKPGNLTSFVSENPKCVILFDEIEKAHLNIIHLFLQILDAGRVRDNYENREVLFRDAILIFTTNAGRGLYENSDSSDFSGVSRKVILKALQNDVNPNTGVSYFPAAICSRFASGNVVMFNGMTACDLRNIAKKEVLRHASNFEKEIGVKIKIDEDVYTALLFAEGCSADARTVRSRAETFLADELFELFRLVNSKSIKTGIKKLNSIHIGVDLPKDNEEISKLFRRKDSFKILVFSSKDYYDQCVELSPDMEFINAQDVDLAKEILNSNDIGLVLIDITFGKSGNENYINIEDMDSKARDFFWHVREKQSDLPVYLLETRERNITPEEKVSFKRQGVRGIIALSDKKNAFASEIKEISEQLYQQKSMSILARANKLISFETAQLICDKGKTAKIRLFDFEMKVAVEAEDSKNILSNVSKPNVKFDEIIGAENAKEELKLFIEYLKNPKEFVENGLRAPRGVLLYGPPGTGKTLLAKAVATEADVTFISAEGNQFLKKYIGEGKDDLHSIFNVARKYAPAILFIDEFEAIAQERVGGEHSAAKGEDVLTALLTEMDGFNTDASRPVFVLAATNFDVAPGSSKSLDQALLRRFDSKIYVDLPNKEERMRFINMKCSSSKAFEISDTETENIALRSTGMSLADLDSIMELSLRIAIRTDDKKVTDNVLDEAFETFMGGEEKKWDVSQLERVARHEAGHTFLCWQSGETPSYVTIVARGDHGGYMQHGDNEGKAIYTKDELLARIRTSLGGRAAEIVYYGEKDGFSTGAGGDLASATNMARQIICTYGMDENFGLAVIEKATNGTGELSLKVRDEVNKILADEMQNAIKLIMENKDAIDALVERLFSENHLTGDEIKEVFENCGKGTNK